MMDKADFLRECMSDFGNVPIDDFNRAYCAVCHNRSCARSNASTMLFDVRAREWKRDLFDEVPTADPNDSQYDAIRSKEFRSVDPSIPSVPTFFTAPAPVRPDVKRTESDPIPPKPAPPAPVPVPVPNAPADREVGNTAFQQGSMLQPSIPQPQDQVLQPGDSYTFGGDDE